MFCAILASSAQTSFLSRQYMCFFRIVRGLPSSSFQTQNPTSRELSNRHAQSFDHFVGAAKQRQRHGDAERLCGFEVDAQLDFGRLLDRQVRRLFALENTAHIAASQGVGGDDIPPVADQTPSPNQTPTSPDPRHSCPTLHPAKLS